MKDSFPLGQIGIVGTGRVSRALALGLGVHSQLPPLIWGRSPVSRAEAAAQVGQCAMAGDLSEIAVSCEVIAIATSDDAIEEIVTALVQSPLPEAPLVFHTSGGKGTDVLAALRRHGAQTAAIHPAMTFAGDPHLEVERMAGARFAVTGSSLEATARARSIVHLLGGIAVDIGDDQRTLYHAALCHASNHLVTLIAGASRALNAAGAQDAGALLAPLVRAALENGLESGIGGLSGPILRGDVGTIDAHLVALAASQPDMLEAYRAMATATIDELDRNNSAVSRSDIRGLLAQR